MTLLLAQEKRSLSPHKTDKYEDRMQKMDFSQQKLTSDCLKPFLQYNSLRYVSTECMAEYLLRKNLSEVVSWKIERIIDT